MSVRVLERREPEILAERRLPDGIELQLGLSAELPYFAGHFDGFPVLPGVVQLHWAILYARRYLGLAGGYPQKLQTKFRQIIRPDEAITLELRYWRERERLTFEYRDTAGIRSSGQVTLAFAA